MNKEEYSLYKNTGIYPYPIAFGELDIDGNIVYLYTMSEEEKDFMNKELECLLKDLDNK